VLCVTPQIDEYAENTYYSDIISALKNIEKPGKEGPQAVCGVRMEAAALPREARSL
jgi:hypothetical protein